MNLFTQGVIPVNTDVIDEHGSKITLAANSVVVITARDNYIYYLDLFQMKNGRIRTDYTLVHRGEVAEKPQLRPIIGRTLKEKIYKLLSYHELNHPEDTNYTQIRDNLFAVLRMFDRRENIKAQERAHVKVKSTNECKN